MMMPLTARVRLYHASTSLSHLSYFLMGCLVGMLAAWLFIGPILSISAKQHYELKILLEHLAPHQAGQQLPKYQWPQLRAINPATQLFNGKEWTNVSI